MLQSPHPSSSSSSLLLANLLKRRRRRRVVHGSCGIKPFALMLNKRKRRTAPIPVTTTTATDSNQKKDTTTTAVAPPPAAATSAAATPRITSVVSILLQQQHLDRHPYLKTIKLIDCDLHNADAIQLADFIHLRGGIAELVLKGNRQLAGTTGVKVLCQAPITQLLDLSCCDLQPSQGAAMAQALAQRPFVLPRLLLAGNYRLFADCDAKDDKSHHHHNIRNGSSIAMFDAACCEKIRHVDVSHCELASDVTIQILNALRRLTFYERHDRRVTIRLEEVIMHACRVGNDKAVDALCALLSQQQSSHINHCHYLQQHKSKSSSLLSNGSTPLSLRVLHLDNPRHNSRQEQHHPVLTSAVSVEQLQKIAEQVVHNYHLEELKIDHYGGPLVATTTTTTTTTLHHDNHIQYNDGAMASAVASSNELQTVHTVLSAHDIWKNMDFYFQLNRAGRRILLLPQQQPPLSPARRQLKTHTASATSMTLCPALSARSKNYNNAHNDGDIDSRYNEDWYSALAMAGNDKNKDDDAHSHNTLELLYWMVRHSADRFGHLRVAPKYHK
jgi:hypothetical protein